MKQYKSVLIFGIVLLIGAASPVATVTKDDKESITRLQGEVLVLQRQLRDLQESLDKWQGQNSTALQKIADNISFTAGKTAGLEDVMKDYESTRKTSYAGTNTQIQKIFDYQVRSDQKLSDMTSKLGSLEITFLDHQKKIEEMLASPPPQTSASGLVRVDGPGSPGSMETDSNEQTLQAAYLKFGMMLLKSERRSEGVNTLRKLIADFPNSHEASQAKDELNRLGEK